MATLSFQPGGETKNVITAFTSSVLVILFLFFIDEGNYSLDLMEEPSNWFAFAIYLIGFLLCQSITYLFILRKYKGEHKNLYTSLIGIPMGFVLVVLVLYLNMNSH